MLLLVLLNTKSSCDNDFWLLKFSFAITGINSFLKYIKIENLKCKSISQYPCFYCIFEQINALVNIRDFFQKYLKSY